MNSKDYKSRLFYIFCKFKPFMFEYDADYNKETVSSKQ